jgi:hypothetical protein
MINLNDPVVDAAANFLKENFDICYSKLPTLIEKEFNCKFTYVNGFGQLEFKDEKYETQFLLRFS